MFFLNSPYRYLGILDSLFDDIVLDMNREEFTVGEKYKAKQSELGKTLVTISLFAHLSRFLLNYEHG